MGTFAKRGLIRSIEREFNARLHPALIHWNLKTDLVGKIKSLFQ